MQIVQQTRGDLPAWRRMAVLELGPGSPRPANPDHEPIPGGNIPTELPPGPPDEMPDTGPTGPRAPYPVNDPGISEPVGPGSEPDYLPGKPTSPMQL